MWKNAFMDCNGDTFIFALCGRYNSGIYKIFLLYIIYYYHIVTLWVSDEGEGEF